MQRVHQIVFVVSLLVLCWLGMMGVHELGHVVGALATGGTVKQVVLHPLTISRTEVSPNPQPAIVVWLGPIVGCLLPVGVWRLVPSRFGIVRNIAMFFAGFCLVANGAYIAFGAFNGVGDCGEMLRTGSPLWTLLLFGGVAMSCGFFCWHRLGSLKKFVSEPAVVAPVTAYVMVLMLGGWIVLLIWPRLLALILILLAISPILLFFGYLNSLLIKRVGILPVLVAWSILGTLIGFFLPAT